MNSNRIDTEKRIEELKEEKKPKQRMIFYYGERPKADLILLFSCIKITQTTWRYT